MACHSKQSWGYLASQASELAAVDPSDISCIIAQGYEGGEFVEP